MIDNNDLPAHFFSAARQVLQFQKTRIEFGAEDLCRIADDPMLTGAFARMFRTSNDADLQALVIDHLQATAERLNDEAQEIDIFSELVDRAGLAVTISITVAATGVAITTGAAALPLTAMCAGAAGIVICGLGRMAFNIRSAKRKAAAKKAMRLAARL